MGWHVRCSDVHALPLIVTLSHPVCLLPLPRSFTEMSDSSVARIFTTILSAHFKKYFNEAVQALTEPLVLSTVEVR